jgi:putative SOS response-associated peptidase YedK
MCARYTLRTPPWQLARALGSRTLERTLPSRYNIAPTQLVPAVLNDPERHVREVRWGLIPPHAPHPSALKLTTFNARIETVAGARTYRDAFRARRCALLADGFFEWRKDEDGGKTPLWIHRTDDAPFAFAGIWELWFARDGGETITSASMITEPATGFMEAIHTRMPVVLDLEGANRWLEHGEREPAELLAALPPVLPGEWTARPVGPRVGNPRFDDPSLIAAVPDAVAVSPTLFDLDETRSKGATG